MEVMNGYMMRASPYGGWRSADAMTYAARAGWTSADLSFVDSHGPLTNAPGWVKQLIFEQEQRNAQGLCWQSGCGKPLHDDTACVEHGEYSKRLEARVMEHISGTEPVPTRRRRIL
jgi:hypothetical protein